MSGDKELSKKKTKRKWPERNTQEYTAKREQNNDAVRRSREKSKQKQEETKGRVENLRKENSHLSDRVLTLQKELTVLKDLFHSHATGSARPLIPPDLTQSNNLSTQTVQNTVLMDHHYITEKAEPR